MFTYIKTLILTPFLSYLVAFVVDRSLRAMNRLDTSLSQTLAYRCLLSFNVFNNRRGWLSRNNEQRPDKGTREVVLDRASCDGAVLKIISDTTKFKLIEKQPTLLRESQLQRLLRNTKDA